MNRAFQLHTFCCYLDFLFSFPSQYLWPWTWLAAQSLLKPTLLSAPCSVCPKVQHQHPVLPSHEAQRVVKLAPLPLRFRFISLYSISSNLLHQWPCRVPLSSLQWLCRHFHTAARRSGGRLRAKAFQRDLYSGVSLPVSLVFQLPSTALGLGWRTRWATCRRPYKIACCLWTKSSDKETRTECGQCLTAVEGSCSD
jgi:hypothetical protein